MLIEKCTSEVREIANLIRNDKTIYSDENFSLAGGTTGICLFLLNAGRYFGDEELLHLSNTLFFKRLNSSRIQTDDMSLYGGSTGIHWLLQYCLNSKLIEENSNIETLLYDYDTHMLQVCKTWENENNYDLLYGMLGAGIYFLQRKGSAQKNKHLFDIYKSIMNFAFSVGDEVYWQTKSDNNTIDLGFAHGIGSIAVLFIQIFQETKNENIARDIERILNTYISIYKKKFNYCLFPNKIQNNLAEDAPTRLAWCYGDLMIAYMFIYAGRILQRNVWTSIGNDILQDTFKRRLEEDNTGVSDNCICHGASGIILILNRICQYVPSVQLLDCRNYWIEKYFDIKSTTNNDAFHYNPTTDIVELQKNNGFLQGLSGMGLSLLDVISNRSSDWTNLLLIK